MNIKESTAARLRERIEGFMSHYHYNRDGSDYSCLFCYEELPAHPPYGNGGPIPHRSDCEGEQLLKDLAQPEEQEYALDDAALQEVPFLLVTRKITDVDLIDAGWGSIPPGSA